MEPRIISRTIDLAVEYQTQQQGWGKRLMLTGSSGADRLVLTIVNNRTPETLTGLNALAYFETLDGDVMKKGQIDGHIVSIDFPDEAYAYKDQITVKVYLSDGKRNIPIHVEKFDIGQGYGETLIDPDDMIPNMSALVAMLEEIKANKEAYDKAAQRAEDAAAAAVAATADANNAASSANAAAASASGAAADASNAAGSANAAASAANDAAGAANAAAAGASNAISAANTAADAANTAADAANAAAEGIGEQVDTAVSAAAAAEQKATEMQTALDSYASDIETLKQVDNTKVDNAEVTPDGELYLLSNGSRVAGPFSGFGGGTGSGSGNNAVLTVKNACDWLSKSIASGESCTVAVNWSSLEDGLETGMGVMTVTVGGVVRVSKSVNQGLVSADVKEWLSAGSNLVRLSVADGYGNNRAINYTVTVVAISLSSTFDASGSFGSAIPFVYVPVGAVNKTVHFEIDGTEIGTANVAVSGRQQSYNIPAQSHGAHSLRVWFEAEINGQTVTSNELYYDLICVEEGNSTPIISSAFRQESAHQYDSLVIPYRVYDPASLTAAIALKVDGEVVNNLTVDRTEQTWTYIPVNTGDLALAIQCGDVEISFTLPVTESKIDVEAETNDLSLYLPSYGRSNGEADPGKWEYGDIAASFTGFNWKSDGWLKDSGNNTVLRVTGDARVFVPFQIFRTDFRGTGKTIEVEFATRDVLDYDAMILSSMSDGRGIAITAQRADMASEQSEIGTQYKEEEHVRLTFVTEKRSGNRLILIYLNGIISGIKQYPDSDDFSQGSPVGLSIGSKDCTIDLYNIRVYDNDLTRYQVLDNWIADTQDGAEKLARFERNQVYDDYGKVVPEKLPRYTPYFVLIGPALPTIKGNKVTISGYYVDPLHPEKSFTFADAEADVQGTSSKDYYIKNIKIKFKNGFEINGVISEGYKLRDDSLPSNVYTMKADVASSEGANNVELVRLYNDISPHKTPPQLTDPRVRQGIDGLPCVIFWDNGEEVAFQGKFNFNHDKASDVFGFAEGDECWEIRNNVSNRVLFKSADYADSSTETGWLNDFEGRYPDGNTDPTNLAAFAAWVVSTDRTAATGAALASAVTYEGATYTADTADYRLAKFKAELADHADVTSAQFYWLFTEFFLMVDSRAKNAFPTRFAADGKWCWLPYDMDTAIGINNEGALVFDFSLEDTDLTAAGELVFNGQESVFWQNVRDAFPAEIAAMYAELRSSGKLSYEAVMERFDAHQNVWPEAIMNEDAYRKYIEPYEVEGSTIYFAMAQGKKELQRTWWLFNRFRYMDAKYDTGTIAQDRILIRIYADADIAITPYADTYLRSKYGSYSYQIRAKRDREYLLHCYVDAANDLETTLFPASLIAEIADLAPLHIGLADFSKATKLQVLKIGDSAADYSNGNLTELTLGNNTLLRLLDVRNCPKLTTAVDLSGCSNIEEIYFDGSSITGLSLPNGGVVRVLHLPSTVTNLTLLNQRLIDDFVLPSYAQITTLWLENMDGIIPVREIFSAIPANSRVRLIGIAWNADSLDDVHALYDRFDTMRGLDEHGVNTDKAQISGTIHVPAASTLEVGELRARYPYIGITADAMSYLVSFYDGTSETPIHTELVPAGGSATDPVSAGVIDAPTKAASGNSAYTYSGWDHSLDNITGDTAVTAVYTETRAYTLTFVNWDGSVLHEEKVAEGATAPDPIATGAILTPTRPADANGIYTYLGWNGSLVNVTSDRTITARYSTSSAMTVTFVDWDGTVLYTAYCASGGGVPDPVVAGLIAAPSRAENTTSQIVYAYTGWDKTFSSVTANTTVTAKYTSTYYYIATFANWDGSVLFEKQYNKNSAVEDPVAAGYIQTPSREPEEDYGYVFKGWDKAFSTSITANVTYTAQYKTDRVFTVTFVDYDGTTVLDTQQVADEEAALDPVTSGRIGVPLRESTAQYTYVYNGWNKTFSKITADLTVTATYTQTTRTYTVRFWDGNTLMAAVESVAYNSTAAYPGTPTKTGVDNPDEYVLEGWSPSNASIKGDTDCYASWLTSTISDSWVEIFAAIDDGSYSTKYAPGDTKKLDLGAQGQVFMQIYAMDEDDLADGSGKAPISWVSQQLLKTTHRMNPSSVAVTEDVSKDAWVVNDAGGWISNNKGMGGSSATAAWQIQAVTEGTLSIGYMVSSEQNYDKLTLKVDGAVIANAISGAGSWLSHSVECAAGTTVSVEATYSKDSSGDKNSDAAYVKFESTGEISVSETIGTVSSKVTVGYEEGTGTIGGWEHSEMRTYLQETIKPLIPEEVRSRLLTVSKYQCSRDTSTQAAAEAQITADDVWIPSYHEVFGNAITGETADMPAYADYLTSSSMRVKKIVGSSSASSWWLRSANYGNYFYIVHTSGSNYHSTANQSLGVALGFCT